MDIATYAYASNAYGLIASVTLNGTMLTRSRPTLVSPFGQPPAVYLRSHQSLRFTATNTWESYRAVLTEKKNKIGTAIISEYDYIVNKDGQRTKATMSGAVFTGTPWWDWAYNAAGEVESAKHSATTAYNRAYGNDGLGNRDKRSEGATDPVNNPFTTGVVTDYTSDSLNQYDSITVGSAAAVTQVHDEDGNLADDGSTYAFEWNAANQLLKVRNRSTNALIATYTYDYLGRRVRKVTGSLDIVYVYDGWNLIAEYDNSGDDPALDRTYVWGLDLSLSMQGAGGVGGLLRVTDHTVSPIKHYYPFYDGNGNVSEYILNGATNAAIHFEYDAFGNVPNSPTGQDDPEFAIQFSTKLVDEETGFSYYGYRYYDPVIGRWASRDPIVERGGPNLYAMVGNDPINWYDYLGLRARISTNKKACTITITLNILLYPSRGDKKAAASLKKVAKRVKQSIEGNWNGKKKGCCKVIVVANVTTEIRRRPELRWAASPPTGRTAKPGTRKSNRDYFRPQPSFLCHWKHEERKMVKWSK